MASSAPWTPGDLRKNARSWTLEGDAQLLEYMQTISENLEKRAQNTNSIMNQLVLNLEETSVSLDNVTNKLSALQHSQFVENRVYEDDETIANESEVPVDIPNEKEAYDPIETLNKVLKNSIAMMDKCYEKVSIDIEDSDDEEGLSKSIVYKPKNFFEHRPLPHIIGSKEWKEKWHIGLCDTDEEYSDEENKEEYSDTSENVSLSASLPSNAPTLSESESSVWGLHPHTNVKRPPVYSPSSEEEISSNTLTSKTSSEDINRLNNNRHMMPPPQVVPPPEQRYYVHKPKEKGLFDESSDESEEEVKRQSQKTQVQPVKQVPVIKPIVNGISNIISDEPPELDEVDRREDNGSNQLFYESEEEKPKKETQRNADRGKADTFSNICKKPVNLFDDDDFDSFMKELDKKATEKVSQNNTAKSVTNLFDDALEDEPEPPPVSALAPPNVVKTETAPLVQERKVFKESLFDEEPEEDNIFANITQKPKNVVGTAVTKKLRNLFDDDSSDDDFENIFKSKFNGASNSNKKSENDSIKKSQVTERGNVNNSDQMIGNVENNNSSEVVKPALPLFSGEPPEDDIFKERFPVTKTNERIEAIKEDDLFNESASKTEERIESKKPNSDKSKSKITIVNSKTRDLFTSDDEDELFGSLGRPPVPTPRASNDSGNKVHVPNRSVNLKPNEFPAPNVPGKLFEDDIMQPLPSEAKSQSVSQSAAERPKESKDKVCDILQDKCPETNDNNKNNKVVDTSEPGKPTQFNIFFDDDPPDDDDIFSIPKKESVLQSEVPKSVKVSGEHSTIDKSKNIGLFPENIQNAVESQPISSKFKLLDLFDDLLSSNKEEGLVTDASKSNKAVAEDHNSSDQLKNVDVLSDKIENTANLQPISSKFKLPDLFDDEPTNDDDDIFSSLSKTTVKSTTSSQSTITNKNSIECEKVTAEVSKDTPQNDIISKSLENQNEYEKEEKNEISQNMAGEKENSKTDNSLSGLHEEEILQQCQKQPIPEPLEEALPDGNTNQEEVNTNANVIEENKTIPQENNLKAVFQKEPNMPQQKNDSDVSISKEESSSSKDSQPDVPLYNSINLLQDIPPDDDFPSSSDTKRLHNIFYDDFAETIPTTSTYSRKQPSNYFFSDEPPPDSFDDDTISDTEKEVPKAVEEPVLSPPLPIEKVEEVEEMPKHLDQSETDNRSFSVADLIKKAGSDTEYKKPKMSVPPPKKLNKNLNINVAALMPGAKRPSLRSEESVRKQSSTEDEESSSSSSLISNTLRQSSTESMTSSIATVVTPSKSADPNILPNLTKSRPKMQGKRPSTREGRQEKYRKSQTLDDTDSVPTQSGSSLPQQVLESKEDNTLEENHSNDSTVFHEIGIEKVERNILPQKAALPKDDWLIKSTQPDKPSHPPQPLKNKKQELVAKVFNDVIDDDDDLFAAVGRAVQEPARIVSQAVDRASPAPPETKLIQGSKSVKSKEPSKSETKAPKSLFTDDESDDDLFASVQKKVKAPSLKTPAASNRDKVFSSDDDDDIFGKALKDSKDDSKNEKKLLKKLPMPNSKSLFGDDDDGDDIFGGATAKNKVTAARVSTVPKKPEKRSPVGSITGDNPLADLLND